MEREIDKRLDSWRGNQVGKPLVLLGTRQVGKTHSLKEFGKRSFSHFHYYNFEKDLLLHSIFENDLDVDRILNELSFYSERKIDEAEDLIIFDEIQECPRALTCLKYFAEDRPGQAICCAGSLIGVKVSSESFPVGKVYYEWLGPMSFAEFLAGIDDQKGLNGLDEVREKHNPSRVIHEYLWGRLKDYFIVGGLPGAVDIFREHIKEKNLAFEKARKLQKDLLRDYVSDFAKHAGKLNATHIQAVFENIPMQLSENIDGSVKRYKFGNVIKNKRSFAELEGPIDWLVKAGLAIKVRICNRAELPLESFCVTNRFKLYLFDSGLLGCMLNIPISALLTENYGMTKGYFAENLTAQAFNRGSDEHLYSWQESKSEIEFLRVIDDTLIPIEVKAGIRTKAKSLQSYRQRYRPEYAIKISAKPLQIDKATGYYHYPLYMAWDI